MKKSSGFILMYVLAVLAVLLVLVVQFVETVQVERQLSINFHLKSRSRILARSGIQFVRARVKNVNLQRNMEFEEVLALGVGTHIENGDRFAVSVTDNSKKININDGIKAGMMEASSDESRPSFDKDPSLKWQYDASVIDPWGSGFSVDRPNKSGLNNLRLRRLLNAYGDAHIYKANGGSGYRFTSTAVKDRGVSIPEDTGLGDVIIKKRLKHRGYYQLEEIKSTVNAWAKINLPFSYLSQAGSFYEMIEDDLTVVSYEDANFYRLRTEMAASSGATDPDNINTAVKPHMWAYQNDFTDARFNPNYLDRFPIDLSDDSSDANLENKLWAPHSVALVNLTKASELVKAAIFYAPVNVSYLCEGAVTHSFFAPPFANHPSINILNTENKPEDANLRNEHGDGRASIGVRGPSFKSSEIKENGVVYADDESRVQKNRLMSLRDAMTLASYFENSLDNGSAEVNNFMEFKKFLTDYRKDERLRLNGSGGGPIYERSAEIPLNTDKTIKFDSGKTLYYYGESKHRVTATFFDENNPYDDEPLWVSQYWKDASAPGGFAGGWFLEDYVERTLPHIYSCARRIPGYLGAPLALTSPYMIVEPYAYVDVNGGRRRDQLRYPGFWSSGPLQGNDFSNQTEAMQQLGHQPKFTIEDLVTRHSIPKVCFISTGAFNIKSVGMVHSPYQKIAQTTITVTLELFKTKYFRTQEDFASLIARKPSNSNDVFITSSANEPGSTHRDIVIGPEFKITTDYVVKPGLPSILERVQSKYWLSCGLKDADSQAGDHISPSNKDAQPSASGIDDSVQAWDLFLSGDARHPKGGLNNIDRTYNADLDRKGISTILPDYGTGPQNDVRSWDYLTHEDPRPQPSPIDTIGGFPVQVNGWKDDFRAFGNRRYTLVCGVAYRAIGALDRFPVKDTVRFVPRGSSIKKDGEMEDAAHHLWAKEDGHDMDPFGGGIFLSTMGQGEFADEDPNPNPFTNYGTPESPSFHVPKTFRDVLYWQLGSRLKDFTRTAKFDASDDLDMSLYDYIPPTETPTGIYLGGQIQPDYTAKSVNSCGVNFHRGFGSAWFRIPTSYPFAQPVYYHSGMNASMWPFSWIPGGRDYPSTHTSSLVRNKTHLFRSIFNLNFTQAFRPSNNDSWGALAKTSTEQFYKGRLDFAFTGVTEAADTQVQIEVGYFSGFDSNFDFEHGVAGYYSNSCTTEALWQPVTSTKWPQKGNMHPLHIGSDSKMIDAGFDGQNSDAVGNIHPDGSLHGADQLYYNRVYGYFWDYDWVTPAPYQFVDSNLLTSNSGLRADMVPKWVEDNPLQADAIFSELGCPIVPEVATVRGSVYTHEVPVYTETPFYYMLWKQRYDTFINYIPTLGKSLGGIPPMNHVLRSSHDAEGGGIFSKVSMQIQHKLKMNTTAECAPGSWHRVYGFWFFRFNPGQMGIGDPEHLEMGDTIKHSDSDNWLTDGIALPSDYPADTVGPHSTTPPYGNSWNSFPAGISRYARDDLEISAGSLSGHGHTHTNATFDVDGLDQFGIWFRDDSNFTEFCTNRLAVKPKFTLVLTEAAGTFLQNLESMDPTIRVSIGAHNQRRAYGYIPASGEVPLNGTGREPELPALRNTSFPADPDLVLRQWPGHALNSSVDDFIFGYGSDISVPGTSYFRGLFHNAYWLAKDTFGDDPYKNRHADEVRYDFREQPSLSLSMSGEHVQNIIPEGSSILHAGASIYFPRDSMDPDTDSYNHSDLRFDIFKDTEHLTKADLFPSTNWVGRSSNNYDCFFTNLKTESSSHLYARFQYTGKRRQRDHKESLDDVTMMSTIINYNQDDVYQIYSDDGGDSSTNIPYIQGIAFRFVPPEEAVVLRWIEN